MRAAIAAIASLAGIAAAGHANAASVELRDAVARVTVIPEDRSDVKVEIVRPNPRLPLEVRASGPNVVVDGGLAHRIHSCRGGPHPSASVWGVGAVDAGSMPQVVIRTPRAVVLASNGAVVGAIGRAASVDLQDSGCSAWTLADVAGGVGIRESGLGTVRLGSAGRLEVQLSGRANIHAVQVREGLAARLSGQGELQVETLDGVLQADVSGMGRVRVAGGRASSVRARVSGVGGVDFGGSADSLDAAISGIGSVHVRQVTGPVSQSVSGMGHVVIDERRS